MARYLGIDIGALKPVDRNVDGVVAMTIDVTQNFIKPLTKKRLFAWHSSLFPGGRSGLEKIRVGRFRNDATESMQVVSGAIGHEKNHYEAPRADLLPEETKAFLQWFNKNDTVDAVLKAGIAHLWFVTIHPFDDGNGRIHRFLIHNILARRGFTPEGTMFPLSASMLKNRIDYDASLEAFSQSLMPLVEYSLDNEGRMTVHNDTATWYRYIDMTAQVEALYRFIEKTIEEELADELSFLASYDETRRAVLEVVDMPDQKVDLFIRVCMQNDSRLSTRKRASHFDFLSDEEITRMEQAVLAAQERRVIKKD